MERPDTMREQSAGGGGRPGGLARYCVAHREVAWLALVAALVWGWLAYTRLAQQEDPKIPDRRAVLVTKFPGADASKVEDLVTRKLEEKLNELQSIEELRSHSRLGVSVIDVTQRPARQTVVDQEWDKLRAKLLEARLPEGCQAPFLDTDFGNTVTLLFGLVSPPASEAEVQARAHLLRTRLDRLRGDKPGRGRAAAFAFFPHEVAEGYRLGLQQRFIQALTARGLASGPPVIDRGQSFILAEFATAATRGELESFMTQFQRSVAGSDGELHPDFAGGGILLGDEPDEVLRSVVRALTPPRYSYRELETVAEALEDDLKQVASVGRVRKIGNVPEALYLLFSIPNLEGYRLDPSLVMQAIATRNAIIPGGVLNTEGQAFPVQLTGEFGAPDSRTGERRFAEDLLNTVVGVAGASGIEAVSRANVTRGLPVYLRDLFEVRRGYENPIGFKVDVLRRESPAGALAQRRAVLLAVEMKEGNVIGRFNEQVRQVVSAFGDPRQARLPEGMDVVTLSDQPGAVRGRIGQFTACFVEALCVVVLVALFLMDGRSALVVAAAIPLTIALTLGGMHLVGVPLHQISIAALIIALGMLVDDPVVASDGINRELAHGQPPGTAAWLGPHKLRRAILFGTIINIVAFLPLMLLPGDKGTFIWALPMVVTLALTSSRIVSMTFIPLLGYYVLRGQKGLEAGGEVRHFLLFRPVDRALVALLPRYRRWLERSLHHPARTLLTALVLLGLSLGVAPFLGQQFFPPAERNQLLIDVDLPESASVVQTRQACADIVQLLQQQPEVETAAVFSGGTAPRFYYNVSPREPGPFLAQILVNTRRAEQVPPLLGRLREALDRTIIGARCVVKQLEQGPPVEAPIQVRVSGPGLDELRRLGDRISDVLREAGAYKVHDDLGRRMPSLEINIDQERASSLGINNAQIGALSQAAFHGVPVTELRDGDHLIPVIIRLRAEERSEAEMIRTLHVRSLKDELVPMNNFASIRLRPEYATIGHFNQLRAITVKAYTMVGELPSRVLARARPAIRQLELPPGFRLEFAGEDKELAQSRSEMGGVMAISLSLIGLAMVLQFRSVMKSIVVMLTVPLGLVGAFAGLTALRAPFGFMALLGIVSLSGVIVSHIIVLSDFIEEARAEGMPLEDALVQAGLVRLRAVLVTVLATVGGLIPLTLSGGELWKPLTSVHIFGLLFATSLTLLVLPTLYYVFAVRLRWIK